MDVSSREKRSKPRLRGPAGHFLQSGLTAKPAQLRRFPVIFGRMQRGFSAIQTAWRRGRDSNLRYRSEWRKRRRSRKLLGFNLLPGDRMVLRLCAQPARFPAQSKGEWLAILRLKVVSTTPLKRPNWFARDCAPTVQSKSKKYLRTMCSSKGERRSSKSMAPWCVVSRPFMNATPTEDVEKFSGFQRAGCAICGWRETRCS